MILEKAIEILQLHYNQPFEFEDSNLYPALKLGIEALKRLKEHREEHIDITFRELPGETEE